MLNIFNHFLFLFLLLYNLIIFSVQLRELRIIPENDVQEIESIIQTPIFSKPSGFYPENFELKLTSEEDTLIYYTLDSTDPRISDTSQEYKDYILIYDKSNEPNIYSNINENDDSPISVSRGNNFKGPVYPVDKGFVVRAVAKNSKGEFSEISSEIYFITTEELLIYKDLTVVSIVINPENFFDPDIGIYVTGTRYQEWKKSENYNPNQGSAAECNYFQRGKDWEREAFITIFNKGEIIVKQTMGIRIKGTSTRNYPGKSFNLYARKKYGKQNVEAELFKNNYDINGKLITSYKSLSLRCIYENNRLKDIFGWDLFKNRKDLLSANMRHSIVFLNGEYWGLYTLQEKIDDYFFENNYLVPHGNIAFSKNGITEEGPTEERDKLLKFFNTYCKKDLTDNTVYEEIKNVIDVDSFIEMFATGIYISIGDWPIRNSGEWRNMGEIIEGNKYADGKWRFTMFDLDYTMGNKYNGVGEVTSNNFKYIEGKITMYPVNLFINLLKYNIEFQNKFINVYCDLSNEVYNTEKVNKLVQEYRETMLDLVAYSQLRWYGWGSKLQGFAYYRQKYETALDTISDFFEIRPQYTLQHMKEFLDLKGNLIDVTIEIKGKGKVQINSIIPDLIDGKWTGKYFSKISISLKAIPEEGSKFKEWDGFIKSIQQNEEIALNDSETIISIFD